MSHVLACAIRHVIMSVQSLVQLHVGIDAVMHVHPLAETCAPDALRCVTRPAKRSARIPLDILV